MARFVLTSDHIVIVDGQDHQGHLKLQEGLGLLYWLIHREGAITDTLMSDGLSDNTKFEIQTSSKEAKQINGLQKAIFILEDADAIFRTFEPQWDPVIEQAIRLLKEWQLEYKIHPLLEEHDAFAQA